MLLAAAIIATNKKRTGWAIFFWIFAVIWVIGVIATAAEGELDGTTLFGGWLWLIIALCLKKKEPQVVINNNYYQTNPAKPNYSDVQEANYRPVEQTVPAQPVSVPASTAQKFCSQCGAPVPDGDKFCTYCGAKAGD